jgi:hypothetical protein
MVKSKRLIAPDNACAGRREMAAHQNHDILAPK